MALNPKAWRCCQRGQTVPLSFSFCLLRLVSRVELVSQALPTAHVEPLGDLPRRQRRFFPQPNRDDKLVRIAFRLLLQIPFFPLQTLEFFADEFDATG